MINPARTSKISALDGAARARGMAALRREGGRRARPPPHWTVPRSRRLRPVRLAAPASR